MPQQNQQLIDFLYNLLLQGNADTNATSRQSQQSLNYAMLDKLSQELGIQSKERLNKPGGAEFNKSLAEMATGLIGKGDLGMLGTAKDLFGPDAFSAATGMDPQTVDFWKQMAIRTIADNIPAMRGEGTGMSLAETPGTIPIQEATSMIGNYSRNLTTELEANTLLEREASRKGQPDKAFTQEIAPSHEYAAKAVDDLKKVEDGLNKGDPSMLAIIMGEIMDDKGNITDPNVQKLVDAYGGNVDRWKKVVLPSFVQGITEQVKRLGRYTMTLRDASGKTIPARPLSVQEVEFIERSHNILGMWLDYEAAENQMSSTLEALTPARIQAMSPQQQPIYAALFQMYQAYKKGDRKAANDYHQAVYNQLIYSGPTGTARNPNAPKGY